jgi:hypothetical protein
LFGLAVGSRLEEGRRPVVLGDARDDGGNIWLVGKKRAVIDE